jgi:hypothetical protein
VTQTYEFQFPTDEAAASAQARFTEKVAAAHGTIRVAPGFRYGLVYLVVNLPDDVDPVETLYPFILRHSDIPVLRWQMELDRQMTDEEVELTAQDIAEGEESFTCWNWRYLPDGPDGIPADELWERIDDTASSGEED